MACDYAFLPVVSFILNVICQVFGMRCIKSLGLLKSIFFGCAFGLVILSITIFIYLNGKANLSQIIYSFVTYGALSYCYFHFINLGETARRIRLLRELMDSKDGLSVSEILEHYNAKEIIEKRLGRLIKSGQIIYRDGRYYIGKPIMLLIASIIVKLKLIILGKRSEFD
ncbi:MAG: hypothetical protein WC330_02235 [Candidatus Omnitrophota bacterium]|jgi:hypothetical protein